jgi:hypothetical protein
VTDDAINNPGKYVRGLHVRQIYRKMYKQQMEANCQLLPVPDDVIDEIIKKYPKLTREECIEHLKGLL